jgi:nicotinate-nucleotide adenylyltransferase
MTREEKVSDEPMALFGGTFDPVHYGHLRCADEARRKLGLKNLYLLPAGSPPHRGVPQATAKQRLDMLHLARQEFPQLLVDDRETRRAGPSFMVDTLRELRAEFGSRSLSLLIGQDAANHLHSWHQWRQLFELANIVILTRPGAHSQYPRELANQIEPRSVPGIRGLHQSGAGAVLHLEVESIDISASKIKNLIGSGSSPRSMLPAAVLQYISENRLYLTA